MWEKGRLNSSQVLEETPTKKQRKKLQRRNRKFLNPNARVIISNLLDPDCPETDLGVETGEGMVIARDQDQEVDTEDLEARADPEVGEEDQGVKIGTEDDITEGLDQGLGQ